MKVITVIATCICALLAVGVATDAAERARAEVECKLTDQQFVYDCEIMLMGRKNKQPIDGATIVIGADMPSMPMAHNVKPVTATPIGNPGMYHARIELAMYGEWALKIDVSGPTRDRIIHKMHFGSAEVGSGSNETRSPQTYDGVGVVLKVDIEKSRVTVDHEEIEGYMKPMVMSYMVTSKARLEGLKPGDKVRFTIDADQRAIVNIVPLRE